ncbi:hypothetical protein [Magnetospirillum molischianum]|uniref:Uncharacterized protein n=1 Tax=Magnetospirillum molischianum DSM 120 TaxID=1150626 RepID=H8FSY6_MAGML|nr:hypothetical protein [Magnetospirillum molischianum]CCG41474.1 hypothetical protein PHAMO_280008 [Magnetospirillum molischianum DSM 120]
MTFNLAHFRAEFAQKMACISAYILELETVSAELHSRVSGFSTRAL